VEIETPRLQLRPWQLTDKPELLRHADNPNIARNLTNIFPHPYVDSDADVWLRARAADEGACHDFAIILDGAAVGGISVSGRSDIHARMAEVGYWLGESHWGMGYMTEALRAMVVYGFQSLDYHRLEAYHFGWNPASGRVLEKAGFRLEGCLRERVFKNGAFTDSFMYGLLREEFL